MKLNIYLSGQSPTRAPWSSVAIVGDEGHNACALDSVRRLSGGAPVFRAEIEVPDDQLDVPEPRTITINCIVGPE